MDARDTGRWGVDLVRGELHRRGLRTSERHEGQRVLLETVGAGGRRRIAVSTRTRGTWQTSIKYGRRTAANEDKDKVWVFVDLTAGDPVYYVVPYQWMSEDIYNAHSAYLARHGGRRAGNPDSNHHAVQLHRIAEWLDHWELVTG